jgi:hypothetical protein
LDAVKFRRYCCDRARPQWKPEATLSDVTVTTNVDLFATCAQVSVAILIVFGVDAVALRTIAALRGERLSTWLFTFWPFKPELAGTSYRRGCLGWFMVLAVAVAVSLPALTCALAVLALWHNWTSAASVVGTLTVLELTIAGVLLFAQVLASAPRTGNKVRSR